MGMSPTEAQAEVERLKTAIAEKRSFGIEPTPDEVQALLYIQMVAAGVPTKDELGPPPDSTAEYGRKCSARPCRRMCWQYASKRRSRSTISRPASDHWRMRLRMSGSSGRRPRHWRSSAAVGL